MDTHTNKFFLRKKQLEALYGNVATIVFFIFFATAAVGGTLITEFSKTPVLLWAAYMCLVSIIRLMFARHLKKTGFEKRGLNFWLNIFLLFSALTGIGTGFLTYYFFDTNNLIYSVFVFVTYVGFLSAGILSNSVYMPAFFAYSLPPTLMVLVSLLLSDDSALSTLAIMVCFYYVVLIGFARKANKAFQENVKWDLERDTLVNELREQKETAEQAIKAKSNFFASASHDLRQPLHALGLFHDALRYRIQEPENLEILDKITHSTQALNELLHGMLDISKLDASVVENSPRDINLFESLSLVNQEFYARAKEKKLDLAFNISSDLNAFVDVSLFERVVRNLVDNAVKYTNKGFVYVTATQVDDSIVLRIEDSGIGIPSDQLENVFSEFNQLDNPERDKQKGLGLGLSIVRRLCKLMRIDISLHSVFGKGTSITLTLPVGEKVEDDEVETDRTLTRGNSDILVIEDDKAVLEGMQLLLETFGFSVATAVDAESAVSLSKRSIPDLIIADYRLPGELDGLVLIDSIREYHNKVIPAILVTGDTAPDRIKHVENADVVVLHKPVEPEVLENAINNALEKRS